jgi:hypothetical protein
VRLLAALLIWSAGFGLCVVWLRTFWREPSHVPRAVLAAPGIIGAAMIVTMITALVLDGASPVGTWVRFVNLVMTGSLLMTGSALLLRWSRTRA